MSFTEEKKTVSSGLKKLWIFSVCICNPLKTKIFWILEAKGMCWIWFWWHFCVYNFLHCLWLVSQSLSNTKEGEAFFEKCFSPHSLDSASWVTSIYHSCLNSCHLSALPLPATPHPILGVPVVSLLYPMYLAYAFMQHFGFLFALTWLDFESPTSRPVLFNRDSPIFWGAISSPAICWWRGGIFWWLYRFKGDAGIKWMRTREAEHTAMQGTGQQKRLAPHLLWLRMLSWIFIHLKTQLILFWA